MLILKLFIIVSLLALCYEFFWSKFHYKNIDRCRLYKIMREVSKTLEGEVELSEALNPIEIDRVWVFNMVGFYIVQMVSIVWLSILDWRRFGWMVIVAVVDYFMSRFCKTYFKYFIKLLVVGIVLGIGYVNGLIWLMK